MTKEFRVVIPASNRIDPTINAAAKVRLKWQGDGITEEFVGQWPVLVQPLFIQGRKDDR